MKLVVQNWCKLSIHVSNPNGDTKLFLYDTNDIYLSLGPSASMAGIGLTHTETTLLY